MSRNSEIKYIFHFKLYFNVPYKFHTSSFKLNNFSVFETSVFVTGKKNVGDLQ